MSGDECRVVQVDGQPVRIRGNGKPLTERDQAALTEVIRAAKAKLATMPPGPLDVTCPTCGATPGRLCRREGSGFGRAPHDERRAAVTT